MSHRPYYRPYFPPTPYPLRNCGASAGASERPGSSVHNPILILDGPLYHAETITPTWIQWTQARLDAFNRPNGARNRAARGPEARPFVVDPAAAARVASFIEPARPDSELVSPTRSGSAFRTPSLSWVPPGFVGLHPCFQITPTPEAAGDPPTSPVFWHQTPNPGPLPGSPVFPLATDSDRDMRAGFSLRLHAPVTSRHQPRTVRCWVPRPLPALIEFLRPLDPTNQAMTESATSSTGGASRFEGWGSGVPAGVAQSRTWNPIPEASWATTPNLHADEVTDSDGESRKLLFSLIKMLRRTRTLIQSIQRPTIVSNKPLPLYLAMADEYQSAIRPDLQDD
ncbi:hypothetical protein PTTG_28895 [Puccinia triticina 1-1 BBBD Race 1]|uniref:Uncharacterized protein n=1 Tax=Puccinia triticina (isolate 1-1 / race 1 (BBBD)) TaxID=630390 RepID=A0A180GA90_PUCT1|nr:hypothetical protein PTTG_28895 [Puccinia triticina 1-1 BBBD Race 1]